MKNRTFLNRIGIAVLVLLAGEAVAAPISPDAIIMGANNSFAGQKIILGSDNDISAQYPLSLVVGHGNIYTNESSDEASLIVGYTNFLELLGGTGVFGASNDVSLSYYSLVAGSYNLVTGDNSAALGYNNLLIAGSNSSSFAIGSGLIISNFSGRSSVVVGNYNKSPVSGEPTRVFTVGNGTSGTTSQRSNAFIVYENGDIKIPKAQGDISMGEFAP